MFINSPHNPTGHCFSEKQLREIAELCRAHGIYLFSDEVYHDLFWDPLIPRPPAACDIYDRAISLGVLSKSYGLPGLRIGWVATRATEPLDSMKSYKDYLSICSPGPSEFLAEVALRNKDRLFAKSTKIIRRNVELLKEFFQRHQDVFEAEIPHAGCLMYPRLKLSDRTSEEFAVDLVTKKNLLILPSNRFDSQDRSHFRLGFGRSNLNECLVVLEEYLQELKCSGAPHK